MASYSLRIHPDVLATTLHLGLSPGAALCSFLLLLPFWLHLVGLLVVLPTNTRLLPCPLLPWPGMQRPPTWILPKFSHLQATLPSQRDCLDHLIINSKFLACLFSLSLSCTSLFFIPWVRTYQLILFYFPSPLQDGCFVKEETLLYPLLHAQSLENYLSHNRHW